MADSRHQQLLALMAALQASGENDILRLEVAKLCEQLFRMNEAIEHYSIIVNKDAKNMDALIGLARCHMSLTNWQEAVDLCQSALTDNRRNPELNYIMACACLELNHTEDARKYYEIAVSENPSYNTEQIRSRFYSKGDPQQKLMHTNEPANYADPLVTTEHPKITFKEVGGLEKLKESIHRKIILPFQKPELFKAYGKSAGGGILLYGPPGCGKTHMARATAGECDAVFICVEINDILDMWFGESEKHLSEIFAMARNEKRAVIFFDEVEAIGGNRNQMRQNQAGKTLVSQLLAEMDGYESQNQNILIIGATNTPWHIDPALRRPGRFNRAVFVPPPDEIARKEILDIHTKDKPIGQLDFNQLAKKTAGFSGADLHELIDNACDFALTRSIDTETINPIEMDDMLKALKDMKPSTLEWLSTVQNYIRYANEGGLYDEVADYLEKHNKENQKWTKRFFK
jgi:SpoVK/Ycf46/Vps4 family AAA+-type ATPase